MISALALGRDERTPAPFSLKREEAKRDAEPNEEKKSELKIQFTKSLALFQFTRRLLSRRVLLGCVFRDSRLLCLLTVSSVPKEGARILNS